MKPLELHIYDKHPDADAYRVGGFYSPYCLVSKDKRFSDAELAAIYWGFVQTDMLWPDSRADPDEMDEDAWSAVCKRWQDAEETVHRFATLPHYDEADQ